MLLFYPSLKQQKGNYSIAGNGTTLSLIWYIEHEQKREWKLLPTKDNVFN